MARHRKREPSKVNLWFSHLCYNSSQIFVSILAFIVGFESLWMPAQVAAESIQFMLPHWAFLMWAFGLMIGGVLSILGILFLNKYIFRAGLSGIIGSALLFVIAGLFLHMTWPTIVIWSSLVVAMGARYWAVGNEGRQIWSQRP